MACLLVYKLKQTNRQMYLPNCVLVTCTSFLILAPRAAFIIIIAITVITIRVIFSIHIVLHFIQCILFYTFSVSILFYTICICIDSTKGRSPHHPDLLYLVCIYAKSRKTNRVDHCVEPKRSLCVFPCVDFPLGG